jgi:intracellular sulfur oxidation DsrE/DsrF family protein
MAKRILSIVETGYRATIEEQDDTVVWFSHALKGAGADMTLLLRGNAVNYAVKRQDTSGLSFGARKQTRPPRLQDDLASLAKKGASILAVHEDVGRYGLKRDDLIPEVELVPKTRLQQLVEEHELVWWW